MIVIFPLLLLFLGCTQDTEKLKSLEEKLESVVEGQENIKKELAEVKKTLQARPPAPTSRKMIEPVNAVIDIDKDFFRGNKNALITLLDFSDYE
jgi:hypothetical protein